jgi:hypothetical protein
MIKKQRELLAAYVPTEKFLWRRIYPETFYEAGSLVDDAEMRYIQLIYEIFITAIDGSRGRIIEDEINLIYMDIENRVALGKFSQEVIAAIKNRLKIKKQSVNEIEKLALEIESGSPDFAKSPPNIKFRFESTVYMVRLLAYGLFSDNDIVLDRVAEVFDVEKLQSATRPKDRDDMDKTLAFLYRGLIQKNERGRQGSKHAARETLDTLKDWYQDNEYVLMCIDKLEKYV